MIEPERFAGRRVEFVIGGDRHITRGLNDIWQRDLNPKGTFGNLYMRGKQSQIYCSVPHDSMCFLLQLFQNSQANDVLLTAEPLVRGTGRILSMHFGADYSQESSLTPDPKTVPTQSLPAGPPLDANTEG